MEFFLSGSFGGDVVEFICLKFYGDIVMIRDVIVVVMFYGGELFEVIFLEVEDDF